MLMLYLLYNVYIVLAEMGVIHGFGQDQFVYLK